MKRVVGKYVLSVMAVLFFFATSAHATTADAPRTPGHHGLPVGEFLSAKDSDIGYIPDTRAFGTATANVLTIPALSLVGYNASMDALKEGLGANRYCSGGCTLIAPVSLPSGALVTELAISGYDNSTTGQISAFLGHCPDFQGSCDTLGDLSSGFSETPGEGYIVGDSFTHTIMNGEVSHLVEVQVSGGDSDTTFDAVHLVWYRQISPAPGVATFLDVPTSHSFFQEVEALVAAEITTGCGGGRYCPDNPVTRGQMAVFLSRALGLHWENFF